MEAATDEPASTPAAGFPRRPGPLPARLDGRQREEFLGLLADGKGIDQALRSMGVSYRAYANTAKGNAEFRAEVTSARRAADQSLDYVAIDQILGGQIRDLKVLFKMWDRRDKARSLNDARKDRTRERAQDRRDRRRWERWERKLRLRVAQDKRVRQLQDQVDRLLAGEEDRVRELYAENRRLQAEVDHLRGQEVDRNIDRIRRKSEPFIAELRLHEPPALGAEELRRLHDLASELPRLDEGDLPRYRDLVAQIGPVQAS